MASCAVAMANQNASSASSIRNWRRKSVRARNFSTSTRGSAAANMICWSSVAGGGAGLWIATAFDWTFFLALTFFLAGAFCSIVCVSMVYPIYG